MRIKSNISNWLSKAMGIMSLSLFLTACEKEIEMDYHEIDPLLIVEARITNEGTDIRITQSRSMNDSVKGKCLQGADITITPNDGTAAFKVAFDNTRQRYHADTKGSKGTTYRLAIDYGGQHFEGTSTMPPPMPVKSSQFVWEMMMEERFLVYEMVAEDPEPDVRNYYWYRMDRKSVRPDIRKRTGTEPYRWSAVDDRGYQPGTISRDILCTSEKKLEEDDPDDWKSVIHEGDTITFQLMSIDVNAHEYYTSLRAGQGEGANPHTNLTGGCLGYFVAGSVTHADTIVFRLADVKQK